uniref:cinnamoyl-CoA reductase 1-like n=1 Tax=Erigeron canadensis TaxID=72917 RepID=UPI001CB8CA0A|nr:cinnamoyl-CoA reductase 1-like [Erigeron canadensis]
MAGSVCVTGAGGFIGSWLVKLLLSKSYIVHATLRNPLDEKNAHLKRLENASENLKLFKADLLDYESVRGAIAGCDGVFHTASPVPSGSVPNPEVELIEPAVNGTLNVLKACCEVNVKKVVYVSSVAAVAVLPNRPDRPLDETFWSDQDFCRSNNDWYCLSKTKAEREAWEFSKTNGIDFKSVCPTLVIGPMLQSSMNASSLALIKYLRDGNEEVENRLRLFVDVRDLAKALLLAYEKPEANGRYICTSHEIRAKELVEMLKKYYPDYKYPTKYTEPKGVFSASSEKLQKLGWSYRPLEETLVDSVENYSQNGLLGNK